MTIHPKHIDRKMSDVRSERKPKANGFLHSTTKNKEQGARNRERGTSDKQPSTIYDKQLTVNRLENSGQQTAINRQPVTMSSSQEKSEENSSQNVGIGEQRVKIQRQQLSTDIRPVGKIRPVAFGGLVSKQSVSSQVSSQSVVSHAVSQCPLDLDNGSRKTKRSFSWDTFDGIRAHTDTPVFNPEPSKIKPKPAETPVANVFSADAFHEKSVDLDIDETGGVERNDGVEMEIDGAGLSQSENVQKASFNEGETAQKSVDAGLDERIHRNTVSDEDIQEIGVLQEGSAVLPSSVSEMSSGDEFDSLDESVRDVVSTWPEPSQSVAEETDWQDPIVFGSEKASADSRRSHDASQSTSFSHIRESDTFDVVPSMHEEYAESQSKVFQRWKLREWCSTIFRNALQGFRDFLGVFHQLAFSQRTALAVLVPVLVVAIGMGGWQTVRRGIAMKGEVLGVSAEGYAGLEQAISDVKARDFSSSETHFADASVSFGEASNLLNSWGTLTVEASRFIPGVSQLASGSYLADAAKNIADAGQLLSRAGSGALLLAPNANGNISFLDAFQNIRGDVAEAEQLLSVAESDLDKVKVEDLPDDKRAAFLKLRTELPTALAGMRLLLDHGDIFSDMLGKNGPRRFLFLFQNNHEMRATGGFIGSYAYLDVANGRVRDFFVDGIFNPDGQLKEDIVPPLPIQKISAGWSLHDSNWFPNFPTSAEKAIFFYEKTGGPTVDGVVAITPDVLKRFLEITGPVRLDQYDVTVDSENFVDLIQYQVEVAYDREENRPKKILSDLAPVLLNRLFGSVASTSSVGKTLSAIEDALSEKHILFYSRNSDLESLVSRAGWSGEVLSSSRDYLSVVNTNINGFKTDGVVKESIKHHADIGNDGAVTDTVTITRRHIGGQTGREWWDAVNADYMRVYVPLGSELVSADGYTRESVTSPLDYDALHFSRDADVEREESSVHIDPASGTRISEDSGKTVFGNWVYVSPGEEVQVTYTYRLPFRVDPKRTDKAGFDSFSAVFQKQSGSSGSELSSVISFPSSWHAVWQSDTHLVPYGESGLRLESDLVTDRFLGVVLSDE